MPGRKQEVASSFEEGALIWSAGLFVGEGSVFVSKRPARKREGYYKYPALTLKMLDGRAVGRFAKTFGLRVLSYPHREDREIFVARAAGTVAIPILEAQLPYLLGTSKGAQTLETLWKCDVEVEGLPNGNPLFEAVPSLPAFDGTRRPRAWLLDTNKFDAKQVAWSSGLFAAEGYATISTKRTRGRVFKYPTLNLSMLDEGAVRSFAATFFVSSYAFERQDLSKPCHRAHVHGSPAEAALRAMYPHLQDTDKGRQVREVFEELSLELRSDGSGETWKRSNGLRGRSLSPEHRRNIALGQRRRWERERSGS